LFFNTHPKNPDVVDATVDRLDFNKKVREVLKRKLRTYLEWKKHTFQELNVKRKFTLKYLRQHYDIIHMYLVWVKPYLRNIRRLHLQDRSESPDLITAFEGSLIEIEILAKKLPTKLDIHKEPKTNKHVYTITLVNFDYRTRPSMGFQQEGYQKGPLHVGKLDITFRAYAWTKEVVEKYLKMKEKEDFELLIEIDASIKVAMEALGGELEKYLEEAGEIFQYKIKDKPKATAKPKRPGSLDPFISVFRGLGEVLGSLAPDRADKVEKHTISKERKTAEDQAKRLAWYLYKDFKKAHKMYTW
ncbi:MAG: hypothetical protein ABH879_01990, partial [archaeon]